MKRRIEKSGVRSQESGFRKAALFLALLLFTVHCPLSTVSFAATKLIIHDGGSGLGGWPVGWGLRSANTTNGSSMKTLVTNSVTGPVTGQYFPVATANYIVTSTAGGARRFYMSAPLSAGVTISGTITPNIYGLESNVACNCGLRYEVLRWSVAQGGIVSSLGISTDDGFTEWTTSATLKTTPTLTPTSTAFAVGDRIAFLFYSDDANGTTEASGRTFTIDYDAATGGDGDTYLSFTETLSFSSDTNNGRSIPSISLLRPLLYWWKQYFDKVFS